GRGYSKNIGDVETSPTLPKLGRIDIRWRNGDQKTDAVVELSSGRISVLRRQNEVATVAIASSVAGRGYGAACRVVRWSEQLRMNRTIGMGF
ncbi:hypothetical protein PanWU01x14_002120, partial [Parasponia andersonii]